MDYDVMWRPALASITQRIYNKTGLIIYKCQHQSAPDYFTQLCNPIASMIHYWSLPFALSSSRRPWRSENQDKKLWFVQFCRRRTHHLEFTFCWYARSATHSLTISTQTENMTVSESQLHVLHLANLWLIWVRAVKQKGSSLVSCWMIKTCGLTQW
jgi:hypothetical protein